MATLDPHNNTVFHVETLNPTKSIHLWQAQNIGKLNRRNKISSLPFWVPDEVNRTFQFRVVLLRGVVKGATEEEDSIAVFVEYIPGPIGEGEERQEEPQEEQKQQQHPQNTAITVTIVNQRELADSIQQAETIEGMNAGNATMGFRQILSAQHLASGDFTKTNAVDSTLGIDIQIEIETNSKTFMSQLATNTDNVASSLWKGASSVFSSFKTVVNKATTQAVQSSSTLLSSRGEERGGGSGTAASASSSGGGRRSSSLPPEGDSDSALPWDEVPPCWRNREQTWRVLVAERLVENEQTFLSGPEMEISDDNAVVLLQVGLASRTILSANSSFDFDKDVHAGFLTHNSALRKQRYNLVPKHVDDCSFWRNYLWKVAVLGSCRNDEQVKIALAILNAPQLSQSPPRHHHPAHEQQHQTSTATSADSPKNANSREGSTASDQHHYQQDQQHPEVVTAAATSTNIEALFTDVMGSADEVLELLTALGGQSIETAPSTVMFDSALHSGNATLPKLQSAIEAIEGRCSSSSSSSVGAVSHEDAVAYKRKIQRLKEVKQNMEAWMRRLQDRLGSMTNVSLNAAAAADVVVDDEIEQEATPKAQQPQQEEEEEKDQEKEEGAISASKEATPAAKSTTSAPSPGSGQGFAKMPWEEDEE